jgi:hypothetical protein
LLPDKGDRHHGHGVGCRQARQPGGRHSASCIGAPPGFTIL